MYIHQIVYSLRNYNSNNLKDDENFRFSELHN